MENDRQFEPLRVANKSVAFLMAATAEYGSELRKLFSPCITGVGPVESAMVTSQLLCRMTGDGKLPDLAVCLGSAGSRKLQQAQIYQVSSVSYRDMDASPLGFEKGITPFLNQPAQLQLPYKIDRIESASLSTGANIISGDAYDEIADDMVDMETYAVMRACQQYDVPMIGLRGISDGKEELSTISDWTQYLHIIDKRLAEAVKRLIDAIEIEEISL